MLKRLVRAIYSTNNFIYDPDLMNLSDLTNLCSLCPGLNGACVYQARALYNRVFDLPGNFTDNCESYGEKRAPIAALSAKKWEVKMFPNPTSGQLNIVSTKTAELLSIEISDLTGKNLLRQKLKTKDYIAKLDLNLINGAYLIRITNGSNESIIKKLLIFK